MASRDKTVIQPNSNNTGRYSRQGAINLAQKISKTKRHISEMNRNPSFERTPQHSSLAKTKAVYESRNETNQSGSGIKKLTVDVSHTHSYTSKVFAEK